MSALATRMVVLVPAIAALLGLVLARRSVRGSRTVALVGSGLTLLAALVELLAVHTSGVAIQVHT
ncbi:MAG TPA: hypothetical protein VGN48_14625, partial [Pedococcus sp.]|nr:hypothetical protein [Pedococcus sp.]